MENSNKINIVIAENTDYAEEALAIYKSIGNVFLPDNNQEALIDALAFCDVLVIRLKYRFDRSLLEKATNLKYIITPTTGLDQIDIEFAKDTGISIISLNGETDFLTGIPSTAEHTWALLLSIVRNILPAVNHVINGGWNRNLFKGNNLKGKKLGIIGYGRVGKQVHKFAEAFSMKVMAWDENDKINELVKFAENIDQLLEESEIICIHIPLVSNFHFLNRNKLEKLKKGSILINTSRGQVWDEVAVAEMLQTGYIKGVATDVVSEEPNWEAIQQNPLIHCLKNGFNIIITPHIAGATYESMQETEIFVAKKFEKIIPNQDGI